MFDISTKAVAETCDIEILDPDTGEAILGENEKPCSITVYGPGSKPFAAAQSANSNKMMKRLRSKGKADTTPDEDLAATAAFLTAITVRLNNFTYKDRPNEPDTFRAMYLDREVGFIAQQVNAGAGDWSNFKRASPSN